MIRPTESPNQVRKRLRKLLRMPVVLSDKVPAGAVQFREKNGRCIGALLGTWARIPANEDRPE